MNRLSKYVLLACAGMSIWGQDAAAYLKQAESQVKAGQYRQAAASYERAISLEPANSQAYEKLGDVYSRLNMPSQAATAYEKSADLTMATPTARQETPRIQMAANRAAPAAAGGNGGGVGGGAPEGLYLMTRFQGGGLEIATYWFHAGTVVRNPVASARNLDVPAERATHPKGVGTYQLQAGQLALTFPDSNIKARFEADAKGGGFGWDAGAFSPVEIFKPGATLDGTFEGGASVGGGAVMSSSTITFRRDGTYERESVGSFSSQGRTTSASGGSVGKERGRYRIDGTALHITPDGSKETVVTTFPYDDGTTGPAPRSVYYGGGMLKRLK